MARLNCLACGGVFATVDRYLHPTHGCVRSVGPTAADVEQPGSVSGPPGWPNPAPICRPDGAA